MPQDETRRVIVAGAGPTGLTLAAELRRGGVPVLLVDRRTHRGQNGSRAAGMQPRTIELLDQRGSVEHFLAAGPPAHIENFGGLKLDYSVLATRYPYPLNILQAETEQLLEEDAAALGAPVNWSTEITHVSDHGDGVRVTVHGPLGTDVIEGSYLAACDGARSTVRRSLSIDFPGTKATMTSLIGDVVLDDPPDPPLFLDRRPLGNVTVIQFRSGWHRVMITEPGRVGVQANSPSLNDLRAATVRVAGTDFGMRNASWVSSFTDVIRQIERYRYGRVLFAGDAAHIHPPAGGQGMNMGMQDAFNLGWKLAAVMRGEVPEDLLDTYNHERHPTAERTVAIVKAQLALYALGDPVDHLRDVLEYALGLSTVNEFLVDRLSQLDIRYPVSGSDAHPLLGRRVPDAAIDHDGSRSRIYELLWPARPVLLALSRDHSAALAAAAPWSDRVRIVTASCPTRSWAIPGAGFAMTPSALLIRPDGYVSWLSTGHADLDSLNRELTRWCGPALPTT